MNVLTHLGWSYAPKRSVEQPYLPWNSILMLQEWTCLPRALPKPKA